MTVLREFSTSIRAYVWSRYHQPALSARTEREIKLGDPSIVNKFKPTLFKFQAKSCH